MNEDANNRLVHMNERLLLLLGYATGLLIIPDPSKPDEPYCEKVKWLFKAVEHVVYLDKPLPPMP